jgi:predicted SnoaL-like aldol condensation-catalyzing enzyme
MVKPRDYIQIAQEFLINASGGTVRTYFEKYVHPEFKHHNVFFKGDAQSLLEAIEENAKSNPDKTFEIKRALQDGDMVAVHSHASQKKNDPGFALIHIFQFKEGKIIEMWDFGQAVPAEMINENGMF